MGEEIGKKIEDRVEKILQMVESKLDSMFDKIAHVIEKRFDDLIENMDIDIELEETDFEDVKDDEEE